jgi:GTP pyrophosphokinase
MTKYSSPEEAGKSFDEFLNSYDFFSPDDKQLVVETFRLAETANAGLMRDNGQPMISHSVAVAKIVVNSLGLNATAVAALFLHESHVKDKKDSQPATGAFPKDVREIAEGLDKISTIDIKTTGLQVETFRKLIVSLSADPRVILIKLADRLEVMRSLTFFSPSSQLKKANETLMLYAPLAHQLGLYGVKSEMEDTALRHIEPQAYRSIKANLRTSDAERSRFIADFLVPIETELRKTELKFEIKSRTKSVYSIWRKMKVQQVPFESVYDVFAIRIILDSDRENEIPDCWKVYSLVTNIYTPDTRRLRDWISKPRATGYESLHITVDTREGRTVEVQIRSKRMDEIAESGIAAHWRYKGVKQLESIQTWLDKVKKMLNEPSDDEEKTLSLKDLKHDEIFVFTPAGDLRQLPAGATVLDFAFDIHTGIGSKCVGARINGKNTTIKERLNTGDVVEILTSKNQTPKADWLNHVITSKARARIKQRIREEETKLAGLGKEMLERRLKNWKLALTDETLTTLIKHFKFKVITDLYAAIANGKIDLTDAKELIVRNETKSAETPVEASSRASDTKPARETKHDILEIDEKLNNVAFKLAKCCNPIFGDEIFGFVTIKEGIKIHRASCPNASRLVEHYAYRIIMARWKQTDSMQSFQATLRIAGYDEPGILGRINDVIMKDTGISIRSVNIANNRGLFDAKLQVYLHDKKQLDMLMVHLQQIKGVEKVVRVN